MQIKNCQPILGLTKYCKPITGFKSLTCKLFLGRNKMKASSNSKVLDSGSSRGQFLQINPDNYHFYSKVNRVPLGAYVWRV